MLVWRTEEQLALRRRRLFALNVLVPLVLVAALTLGGAPGFHAAAVYVVLFTFFGVFGSAIPLVRDGERGLLQRIWLSGFPLGRYLVERTLSGALLDVLQLLPALGVVLAGAGLGVHRIGVLAVALLATVLAANALGVWVAALARSIAEAALMGAVISLFLLHGAGVFRTPSPGSPGASIEALLPFTALHDALLSVLTPGAALPVAAALAEGAVACAGALALLLLTALAAPRLVGRLMASPPA